MNYFSTAVASIIILSTFCSHLHAAENPEESRKHTISMGYAVTDVSGSVKNKYNSTSTGFSQDLVDHFRWQDGFNLKYRYELSDEWGGVVSYTQTSIDSSGRNAARKMRYSDLMLGPSYRFNDYFSTYALIGISKGEYDLRQKNNEEKEIKYGLSSGIGIQVNPFKSLAIDIGYEFSHLKYKNASGDYNSFVVGAGYRF